ncbi:MAG: hypothetical protein M1831_001461 [Alyxoria varia]|nr:MAG: hypothetical protein M1831_001461 [Alyxoria varia]
MAARKLNVAIAGLGRMGARHALHLLGSTPRANLTAAFSPSDKELAWAQHHLTPYGVTLYKDYGEMLRHEGLEAVLIATVTTVHAEMAIKAIEGGLHVLCEKPLSTSVEVSQTVVDAARRRPDLKVMCGFSRRFDASYRDAWERVKSGSIGRPSVFRSQTCDKIDPSGFFVDYAQFSGGIFVDCNVHDIDLMCWYFSLTPSTPVKSIHAIGITAIQPGLKKHNDVDNALGLIELHDGRIATVYSSRMNAPGQHDTTEIIGTAGKISVNANPATNLLEVHEGDGIRREIPPTYYERFKEAFIKEVNEFVGCVLDGKDLPLGLEQAVMAVRIAGWLQESLVKGVKIDFDQDGKRVERAKL